MYDGFPRDFRAPGPDNEPAPRAPAAPVAKRGRPRREQPGDDAGLTVMPIEAQRTPSVARVCEHLDCSLYEIRSSEEPTRVLIARDLDLMDDSRGFRASPHFASLDALEFFCRANLARFLGIGAIPPRPRGWFWNR
ncbi:MAG: hypothetical protein OEZ08_15660 [Betaproteobacteria bacterium]|nr:hypothetical protein [Betaproteobacteria bacterium]